ncbi:hypothetical protein VPH35_041508 [Triticum aestivum]
MATRATMAPAPINTFGQVPPYSPTPAPSSSGALPKPLSRGPRPPPLRPSSPEPAAAFFHRASGGSAFLSRAFPWMFPAVIHFTVGRAAPVSVGRPGPCRRLSRALPPFCSIRCP